MGSLPQCAKQPPRHIQVNMELPLLMSGLTFCTPKGHKEACHASPYESQPFSSGSSQDFCWLTQLRHSSAIDKVRIYGALS